MKRRFLLLAVLLCLSCSLNRVNASKAFPYSDITQETWYYNAVVTATEKQLMVGVASDRFSPLEPASRAQAVQTLYSLARKPETGYRYFKDTKDDAWYTEAISFADQENIAHGYPNQTFRPQQSIYREELIVMLYSACSYFHKDCNYQKPKKNFSDYSSISPYAKKAMEWAIANEILVGYNSRIEPRTTVNRAQLATALVAFSKLSTLKNDDMSITPNLSINSDSQSPGFLCKGLKESWKNKKGTQESLLTSPTRQEVLYCGKLLTTTNKHYLHWDTVPDIVEIERWDVSVAGNESATPIEVYVLTDSDNLNLCADMIYQITATWKDSKYINRGFSGTCVYRFVTA